VREWLEALDRLRDDQLSQTSTTEKTSSACFGNASSHHVRCQLDSSPTIIPNNTQLRQWSMCHPELGMVHPSFRRNSPLCRNDYRRRDHDTKIPSSIRHGNSTLFRKKQPDEFSAESHPSVTWRHPKRSKKNRQN